MGTLRSSDGVVVFAQEGVGEVRRVESGDVTAEFGRADRALDTTPLFQGLPDDMCQCRHQGHVVSGMLTSRQGTGRSTLERARPSTCLPATSRSSRQDANGYSSPQPRSSARPTTRSVAMPPPHRAPATGPPSRHSSGFWSPHRACTDTPQRRFDRRPYRTSVRQPASRDTTARRCRSVGTTSGFLRRAAFVGSMEKRECWRSRVQVRTGRAAVA
jgi:hypothetical protein